VKKIMFFGGTGQAKVMRSLADSVGKLMAVLDHTCDMYAPFDDVDFYNGQFCYDEWKQNTPDFREYYFVVTIGNPHGKVRQQLSKKLINDGLKPISLIHPTSIIEDSATIGSSVQIHAGAYIGSFSKVSDFCIINTKSSVDHECQLGSGVEVAPGAILCGEVVVGENTWIGAGSVVKERLKIGKNVIVGCGSTIINDISDNKVIVETKSKREL